MADIDGYIAHLTTGATGVVRYKMRGQDSGATLPGFVTWVSNSPDFEGAGYFGGTPTPIGSMIADSVVIVAEEVV
jgi:hypothetical protein